MKDFAAMEYKISLITPVYNASKYLEDTFESVKNQTIGFDAIEYLMVDDCSTDDSGEMIARWAAQYPNVKHLTTAKNSGTPAAPRNLALDHATAPFVMFLDNDDQLFPNACKALYDEITATGADLVTGDARLMDAEGFTQEERKLLIYSTDHVKEGKYQIDEPIAGWVEPFINNHWCKIYRRSLIEKYEIRSLDGELWEDILFLLLYVVVSHTLIYIKEPIINYRARRESLSHVYDKEFYCSLPKSINFGMERAVALKKEELYVKLLNYGFSVVEFYIDKLLDDESLNKNELEECVLAWKEPLVYCPKYGKEFHSAYSKILSDDFMRNEDDQALFHFRTLKALYKQRQKEKEDIFNSSAFKLAKKLSDFKSKLLG